MMLFTLCVGVRCAPLPGINGNKLNMTLCIFLSNSFLCDADPFCLCVCVCGDFETHCVLYLV